MAGNVPSTLASAMRKPFGRPTPAARRIGTRFFDNALGSSALTSNARIVPGGTSVTLASAFTWLSVDALVNRRTRQGAGRKSGQPLVECSTSVDVLERRDDEVVGQ